jgi:hypothetical protein
MAKHIELYDTFPVKIKATPKEKSLVMKDSDQEIKKGYSLICEVNATHSGTIINNRIYPPESMKKGIRSWTAPYKKPVLTNHDDTQDPIGRVIAAKYLKTERGMTDMDYKPILRESEGYGYQRLTIKVTDPSAIQKILDGRYETVSVRMSTDHCICSICGTDWSGGEGPCEHTPGTKYEGKLAYMTTGDLSYREVSFVNIPADEYAGVKEAVMSDSQNVSEVSLYANNDSEKVLSDLGSGNNLYVLLDAEAEASDDVVTYLLDKSNKAKQINKEEDVKLTELTKDQLKDLDQVKDLINEAVDKAKKDCEEAIKVAAAKVQKDAEDAKAQKDLEDAKAKEEADKLAADALAAEAEDKKKKESAKEEEKEEGKKTKSGAEHEKGESEKKEEEEEEEDKKKKKEEEEEEEGEEEDKKKKKKESPTENKKEGKTGGVKHGAGNIGPTGEDPGDSVDLTQKVQELEDTNKKVLDENVKINSELHKMVAERLYDLKKVLRKPDVVSVSTPDARNKKVEEFATRSIDSLKDQIKDLLIEQETALAAGFDGRDVENPAISQSDLTNEVMADKKKALTGKQDTLTRLFPKAK